MAPILNTNTTGHDPLTEAIIGAGMDVHRTLGPGLLESAYEQCLVIALTSEGFRVSQQVELPIDYRGHRISPAYRLDLVANEQVVVEVKAVEALLPIHEAQLLTYLKLSRHRVGLLMNFCVPVLKDGIRRRVL